MDKLPVIFESEWLVAYSIKPWDGFYKIEHRKKSDAWVAVHASGYEALIDPETLKFMVRFLV